jgi:serine/threonine kinase PknH
MEEAVTIFISYSSQDRSAIDNLLAALHKTKKPVWLDEELAGGEAWWRVILDQIRSCEIFLVAVSNHSLDSKPCQAELRYAQALKRPILPVQIGPIDSMRANPLAAVQLIDYRNPTVETGIQLVTAVHDLWEKRPELPSPLPEEPPVPFEYLLRLASALEDSDLSVQQQTQLLNELKSALEEDGQDPAVRRDITRLLVVLRNRGDVAWKTRTEVDKLLTSIGAPVAEGAKEQASTTETGGPARAPTVQPSQPIIQAGPQPNVRTTQPSFQPNHPAFPTPPSWASQTPPPPARPGPPSGPMPLMGQHYPPPPGGGGPYAQPAKRRRKRWVIAGASAVGVAAAVVVAWLIIPPPPPPPPPPPKLVPLDQSHLDSILLTAGQVNSIMDATTMQSFKIGHQLVDTPFGAALANQDCRGALVPGQTPIYQPSGYSGVSFQAVEDPTQNPEHVVVQAAVVFSSIDLAQAFMKTSQAKWQSCAGKVVADNQNGKAPSGWAFGDLTGSDTKITQLDTQEGQSGWQCQRALDREANLVVDVSACGYHISDQADRIATKMTANATS